MASPGPSGDLERALDVASTVLERVIDVIDDATFDLERVVDLDSIVMFGQETPIRDLTLLTRQVLTGAEHITVFVLRSLEQSILEESATIRATACLIWSRPGNWDDHEREFDVTLELTRNDVWQIQRILIDPATPEYVPFPEDGAGSVAETGGEA